MQQYHKHTTKLKRLTLPQQFLNFIAYQERPHVKFIHLACLMPCIAQSLISAGSSNQFSFIVCPKQKQDYKK